MEQTTSRRLAWGTAVLCLAATVAVWILEAEGGAVEQPVARR
jgi:hypothetical protein